MCDPDISYLIKFTPPLELRLTEHSELGNNEDNLTMSEPPDMHSRRARKQAKCCSSSVYPCFSSWPTNSFIQMTRQLTS